MGKHTHICKQCGKTYENYKENSNFCSKICQNEYRNSFTYNCDNCGKEIIVEPHRLRDLETGKHKNLFCSKKCANIFHTTSIIKICERCGKSYKIIPAFKDIQKFCSQDCYKKYRVENGIPPKICPICNKTFRTTHRNQIYCSKKCNGISGQNRIRCSCDYCGKEFDRIKSEVEKNKRHYCSNECKILGMTWSHEDIEKLKKYYGKLPKRELLKIISDKWDYDAIRRKAQYLGLTTSRNWTEDEIKILKENYSKCMMKELLILLPNRTNLSITEKAKEYKLVSYFILSQRYTDEEDLFIKNNYLIMDNEELAEKLHRTVSGISQHMYKLGLSRPLEKHNYGNLNRYMMTKLTVWKNNVKKEANYICQLSNKKSNIIVHHIYGFNLLMAETIDILNFPIYTDLNLYSQDELDLFIKTFLDLQEYYGQYICITETIHKQFHSLYGYGDNTKEQWDDFVDKYYN